MQHNTIQNLLGNTDIYLIDQILKCRYLTGDRILDAGCGYGRNLHWFIQNKMLVFGTDIDPSPIQQLKENNPLLPGERFQVAPTEQIPFGTDFFDHVLSIAVLHFAEGQDHFRRMLAEMVRVLKPNGSLFIRMASDIGIAEKVEFINDGVYRLPDHTKRYLLTKQLLMLVLEQYPLKFLEPLKTVNVNDLRCMSTLVFRKTG